MLTFIVFFALGWLACGHLAFIISANQFEEYAPNVASGSYMLGPIALLCALDIGHM